MSAGKIIPGRYMEIELKPHYVLSLQEETEGIMTVALRQDNKQPDRGGRASVILTAWIPMVKWRTAVYLSDQEASNASEVLSANLDKARADLDEANRRIAEAVQHVAEAYQTLPPGGSLAHRVLAALQPERYHKACCGLTDTFRCKTHGLNVEMLKVNMSPTSSVFHCYACHGETRLYNWDGTPPVGLKPMAPYL